MTTRFSYFSHIESLDAGNLVLTHPFQAARQESLLCRYALHRADASVLAPDPAYAGALRWHRLLPFSGEAIKPPDLPVCQFQERQADEGPRLLETRVEATLPYHFAMAALAGMGGGEAFAVSPQGWGACLAESAQNYHLWQPGAGPTAYSGSLHRAHQVAASQHARAADLGSWGNPYRLDAWKCVGLEIATRHAQDMPTLVALDPQGEMLAGLLGAVEHYLDVANRVPFRLIGVQVRPFHQLAMAFEGGEVDATALQQANNHLALLPPPAMLSRLVQGLMSALGTMITLDEENGTSPEACFDAALKRLLRTGFVDEEDCVYLLSAGY